MNPYFYSLHMLITGRMHDQKYLSAMDVLADQIADETQPMKPLMLKISSSFGIKPDIEIAK